MNQLRFRSRLVLILSLFAIVPALLLTLLWSGTVSTALPFVTGRSAWDSVAASGEKAIAAARQAPLTASQRRAIDAHERELRLSVEQARRYSFLATRTVRVIAIAGVLALLVLTGAASRVAGHLSRQLSRPLDELVRWTELIGHGEPLPPPPEPTVVPPDRKNGDDGTTMEVTTSRVRGAPEFETLRRSMREMVSELEHGRRQAVEAERLHAFRESARRVAHEIKNPLTPIRFALARLRGHAPEELQEDVGVIAVESDRLDRMARSFAEFGRLPEGPPAEIDMGELIRYTARSCVPPAIALDLQIDDNLPRVHGHNGALAGALSNVLLNAVDASGDAGRITVRARSVSSASGESAVRISVADNGKGIAPEKLETIWEPYVTNKPGGTGLGLAIARQAVWAHDGTVNATSTLGKGTEIQLTIPANGVNAERKS
ncbi:MAG: putative two-component histidine kinase [Gemmatimonadales bacterium]|jgi:signal transduction histidine kinase|nr:putative two-component histidine kinase [Gemmatimonadales bacterium]